MSNAKVRARRRRRGNRAWTKAMQSEVYTVAPWRRDGMPSHFWAQLDAAIAMQPALDRLLRERFPHALFVHDEVIAEVPAADVGAAKAHGAQLLQEWHRANPAAYGYAQTLRTHSDRPTVWEVEPGARKTMRPLHWMKRGVRPGPIIVPSDYEAIERRFRELDEAERRAESCEDDKVCAHGFTREVDQNGTPICEQCP